MIFAKKFQCVIACRSLRVTPISMRVVLQRVKSASVSVGGTVIGSIDKGVVCLLGICEKDVSDPASQFTWLSKKILTARLFPNEEGKQWSASLKSLELPILLISQFTLHGNLRKVKPDFHRSAKTEDARRIWEEILGHFRREHGEGRVQTGEFGADMDVSLCNWGPVTLTLDSGNRGESYFEELQGSGGSGEKGEGPAGTAAPVGANAEGGGGSTSEQSKPATKEAGLDGGQTSTASGENGEDGVFSALDADTFFSSPTDCIKLVRGTPNSVHRLLLFSNVCLLPPLQPLFTFSSATTLCTYYSLAPLTPLHFPVPI